MTQSVHGHLNVVLESSQEKFWKSNLPIFRVNLLIQFFDKKKSRWMAQERIKKSVTLTDKEATGSKYGHFSCFLIANKNLFQFFYV
tara:strand:+ start:318 stop:575 length:258 start_codon:yes stop_codon:yes gene_type:complete